MQLIDPHSALIAQEKALIPSSCLIDGRTEVDQLSFLTQFASVINFYDHENTIQGNWSPFLLKDPAILLAYISKTKITDINSLFHSICTQIEQVTDEDKIPKVLIIGMNDLFDQVISIFLRIERWTYFMLLNAVEYELKKYVIHQVKYTYSPYFYAVLTLRDKLSAINYRHRIKPVHYYLYDKFDQLTWKQQKDKSPYWEILGLATAIGPDTKAKDVFNALKNAGNEVILFLEAIVSFATKEYPVVKALKGKYPDTLLLRAFVDLFGNYTAQINGIANQHLQFYYQDILKQGLMEPVADQVLVFADLASTDSTFMLPAGTLLNGGLDTQKKQILFETIKDVNLNPAKITSVYTIGKYRNTNNLTPIQHIVNPDVLQKDENGKVKSFDFFGNTTATSTPTIPPATFGYAISSPLLYLKEGIRKITLELVGLTQIQSDQTILKFYLSTSNAWFQIEPCKILGNVVVFNLKPGDPEIVAFVKNPELLDSAWPTLKMEFSNMNSLTTLLSQLDYPVLTVDVTGAKASQLSNDFGTISSKNPYQPFGPTPLVNSNFIIGSNEVFSKPISSLQMEIDWNNLPEDFSLYYKIYNYYLSGRLVYIPWLCRLFGKKPKLDTMVEQFGNTSFTVNFTLLQESTWKNFDFVAEQQEALDPANSKTPVTAIARSIPQLLFHEISSNLLAEKSNFCAIPITSEIVEWANLIDGDPKIQNTPQFKYTENSTSGFMKLTLDGISHGFGSALYPNVVAQVALYNSWMLYHKKLLNKLMPAASLPFAPKISQISFNYTASAILTDVSQYPYHCSTYSALGNKVLTYKQQALSTNVNAVKSADQELPLQTNDLLFSATYSGFLFLEFENLVPSESINLYFQLTINQDTLNNPERKVTYFYLNGEGWTSLPIIADETANFSCSGIISLTVPTAISPQKFMGEKDKYWICIAADHNSSSFPGIAMLKANGLMTRRFSAGESITKLPSGTISKTQFPIPQIATITQPFTSFGGIGVEDPIQMNQRVSLRLKTKDRAVTSTDYYQLIIKNFDSIFYAKTLFDKKNKVNRVCVIPHVQNWQDPSALVPLLNQGILDGINNFLTARTSGLIPLHVVNFDLLSVKISATIKVMTGYTLSGVANNVNQALILFLSPWIAGSQPKITINQGLDPIEVATFIQNIPGVISVSDVSWPTITEGDSILIVSDAHHSLTCNY